MKKLSRLIGALIMMSVLAACAPVAAPQAVETPTATEESAAASTATECAEGLRLFEHEYLGSDPLCVPENPQRIVGLHDLRITFSLGLMSVKSIATVNQERFEAAALDAGITDLFEGIEFVGTSGEPNLEAIIALEPDLIIVMKSAGEPIYEELSSIAPTVMIDLPPYVPTSPPEETLSTQELLADLTNVRDVFDAQVAEYEARVEALKAGYPDLWPNLEYVRMIALGTEYFRVDDHRPDSPDFKVLSDLGAVQSNTVDFEQTENEIDLETLINYDGDVILLGGNYLGTPEEESADPVVRDLLATTHAGQLGQIFLVETAVWGFSTTRNLMLVLDDLERIVSENELDVSGDFR